jgi:hypothetical protein
LMTREEWLTAVGKFMAERMGDAPDDECRSLADAVCEEVEDMAAGNGKQPED